MFLGSDAAFGADDGVVRTRVDYAGGAKSDPSDEIRGNRTEVVQTEYDPVQFSFGEVLR
ncbi:peptide-methionine (S)-S-oxide reductase [Natrinema caseinilyticum]|uniref:peptide-methionine (S)-S-oxide reductase n=1 Tax=Natrinema caseinilyticum TaxID=2961570 RepID=UPI003CCDBE9F